MIENFEEFYNEHQHLIYYMMYKFDKLRDIVGKNEMISSANYAIWRAYETFDESKGIKSSTYVTQCIKNEFKQLLRKLYYQKDKQFHKKQYISIHYSFSNGKGGKEIELGEVLPDLQEWSNTQKVAEIRNQNSLLHNLIKNTLTENEEYIIISYYFHKKTQQEIADILGVTQACISATIRRALKKLQIRIILDDHYHDLLPTVEGEIA